MISVVRFTVTIFVDLILKFLIADFFVRAKVEVGA
jgi:hypothetical protein